MSLGNSIAVCVLLLALAASCGSCFGQGDAASTDQPSGGSATATPQEIPIELLRKLDLGYSLYGYYGEIKADLSPDQIQAMKKVSDSHRKGDDPVHQVSGVLSNSRLRNRRFAVAIEQIKREREAELLKQWLTIVTPEQQASIRRRNRQAILAATRPPYIPSVLEHHSSIDSSMTNHDLLSVLEQPSIQDLLELSDSQWQVVEEQQSLADIDAVVTIRHVVELFAQIQPEYPSSDMKPVYQTQERLLAETQKILTPEQWVKYEKQVRDPQRIKFLVKYMGYEMARDIIRLHGYSGYSTTPTDPGKFTVEVTMHNAFDDEWVVEVLKLTDEQQQKIAKLLKDFTPEIIALITLSHEEYQRLVKQREVKRTEILNEPLRTHNAKFNAPIMALLTEQQTARLQKESFRQLGIRSLGNPDVIRELGITETQSAAIASALQKPGPKFSDMKPPAAGEDSTKRFERFRQQSDEHSRLTFEHLNAVERQVIALLSDRQRQQFQELTGYKFRPPVEAAGAANPTTRAASEGGEIKR